MYGLGKDWLPGGVTCRGSNGCQLLRGVFTRYMAIQRSIGDMRGNPSLSHLIMCSLLPGTDIT